MSTVKWLPDLAPFWKKGPDLWFIKLEAIFYINCIVDERTKANMAISHLNSETVGLVNDLVTNPDPVVPYTSLKERLTAIYSAITQKSLEQALQHRMLDGLKPSKILAHLLELNRHSCSEAVVKSIFLDQLPKHVQAILATARCTELQELGKLADEIVKIIEPPHDGTVHNPNYQMRDAASKIKSLKTSVHWLKSKVEELEHKLYKSDRQARFRERKRKRSSSSNSGSSSSSSTSSSSKRSHDGREKEKSSKEYKCKCSKPCANHKEHLAKIKEIFFPGVEKKSYRSNRVGL